MVRVPYTRPEATPAAALYPVGAQVLAIDPGATTGLVVRDVATGQILHRHTAKIDRAGFTQQYAIALLDAVLGSDGVRLWMAAVEHAVPIRRGAGAPPAHAETYWLNAIDLCARERVKRLGAKWRKPTIARPHASDWRGALGIRTKAALPRTATHDERRADLKGAAVAYLRQVEGIDIQQVDEAEAACLASWTCGLAHIGAARVGRKFKDIVWSP